jgi:hypothetical protein
VNGAVLGRARIEADRWTFELGPVHIPPGAAEAALAAAAMPEPAVVTASPSGRSGSRRRSKRVARGTGTARSSGPLTAHDRLVRAMAAALGEADPDGRLVERMADPEAVGRAAARAILSSVR